MIVPNNLEECFEVLKGMDSPEAVDRLKRCTEDEIGMYHFGLGRNLRNEWGLWQEPVNNLVQYFNKLGIYHPDDMSGIILTSFHRHLNNVDLKLQEQVKYYRDYWEKNDPKVNRGEI